MPKSSILIAALAAAGALALPTQASAHDPVAGAIIGGGIGAALGGPPGAAIGAILGTIAGGEGHHGHAYPDYAYDEPRHAPRRYGPPPAYYPPAPAYYPPAPVYYAPQPPVYYAPPVHYSAPAYRPARAFGGHHYAPRYERHGYRVDGYRNDGHRGRHDDRWDRHDGRGR